MHSTRLLASSALAVLMVVGFGMTVWGLIAAYVGARRDLKASEAMFNRTVELDRQEIANVDAYLQEPLEEQKASIEKYRALHEANGWPRPPGMSEPTHAGLEAVFVLRKALRSAGSNLILAGVGLLISTAASVAALFI